MVEPGRQRAAFLVATVINRLPLNEVTRDASGERVVYHKRRRWYAPLLITAGRLAGSRFDHLSGEAWRRWERAVYAQLYGEEVRVSPDGRLTVPARPGAVLATMLAGDPGAPWALTACEAALAALAELHERSVVGPGGTAQPFSHGDATVANVTYETGSGRAWWFDFETTAPAGRSAAWRQADDLRALLFSATAVLGVARGTALARAIDARYAGTPVPAELRTIVARLQRHPDPLHLAQTRIAPAAAAALAEVITGSNGRDQR